MMGRERQFENAPGEMVSVDCRRAYYRVHARMPVRVTPLASSELEAAIFELSTSRTTSASGAEGEEVDTLVLARLARIEEKLDRLLGYAQPDGPEPIGAADLEWIVFSGAGFAMPIEEPFEKGDWFQVEMLLPAPENRLLNGVGCAVDSAQPADNGSARFELPLSLEYMPDEDRDALVAYSYELQRVALRSREEGIKAE